MSARVLVVCGSPSAGSRCDRLTRVVAGHLAAGHLLSAVVTVRELPCTALTTGDHRHPAVRETAAHLGAADALVVVAPVYKSSLPGLLKCWFDLMPRLGLLGRAVLPVATAHSVTDLPRYAEALDIVLTSMGVATVLPVVGLSDAPDPASGPTPALLTASVDQLCATAGRGSGLAAAGQADAGYADAVGSRR